MTIKITFEMQETIESNCQDLVLEDDDDVEVNSDKEINEVKAEIENEEINSADDNDLDVKIEDIQSKKKSEKKNILFSWKWDIKY